MPRDLVENSYADSQGTPFAAATGETRELQDFIAVALEAVDLNWKEYTEINQTLFRPTDMMIARGDARETMSPE